MQWLSRHLAIAGLLVALADWLFYGPEALCLSVGIFFVACALTTIAINPIRARGFLRLALSISFGLGVLTVIENLSWLSLLVASSTTLLFALSMVSGHVAHWLPELGRALGLPIVGGFWMIGDISRARTLASRKQRVGSGAAALTAWIAPVSLSIVFLSLFASANPLIEAWAGLIDPRRLLDAVSIGRVGFWLLALWAVWPFAHMHYIRPMPMVVPNDHVSSSHDLDIYFGAPAVIRSLVMFNVLFATQSLLDAAYLWGGLALPEGLTYADYAHRGAYPLIITALLAAIFTLIAMRPGGPVDFSPWIKPLVLIFVAQNILLVLSSIFRTNLYVAAYSLTEFRLAAMIWMGLVGLGLMLIVVQIIKRKSNKWLLDANALAAAVVLYTVCFVNFPYVVARYNVAHCRETTGQGPTLDMDYLISLGPQALPAYDSFASDPALRSNARAAVSEIRWRSWSFRGWRLKRYFATQEVERSDAPSGAPGNL